MDVPFEKDGNLVHFEDGHVPETNIQSRTQIVKYYDAPPNPSVQIYDNALPSSLCHEIYDHTVKHDIPWGTYVTKEEALNECVDPTISAIRSSSSDTIQDLAKRAVRHFIFKNHDELQSAQIQQVAGKRLRPEKDDRIHGVQLWALPATRGSSVPYHIDYAEYIRYTENVIVTPLYAGTVQCTPHPISGGTFAVNLGGLTHYQEYGYKGGLKDDGDRMAGWEDNNAEKVVVKDGWVSIPYKFNQGVMHNGTLPHLSGPIIDMEEGKRVIVGFNAFGHVGEFVRKCPDHSDKFRRMVKLHRSMRNVKGRSISTGIKIEDVKKNKALTKLLVLAKRQKEKDQWKETRKGMTRWILEQCHVMKHEEDTDKNTKNPGMAVSDLLSHWKGENNKQPTKEDLHIQIHRMVKEGNLQLAKTDSDNAHCCGLIGLDAIILFQAKS